MKIYLVALIAILSLTTGCSQPKKMKTDNSLIAKEFKSYKFIDDSRPGYYLQINNQNCHYEIKTNDLSTARFFDAYSSYSVRVPLNLNILKSGEQSLSIKVLPLQGNTLSEKADLQLRLMMYPDMTDKENDYGGGITLWDWEMPAIEEALPLFEFDTVFEAKVPYKLNILDKYALDLSKMDKDILLEEVIALFATKIKDIENHKHDKDDWLNILQRAGIQIYMTQEMLSKSAEEPISQKPNEILQPLENYRLQLYGNGKIATLLNTIDNDSAIWWADKDTGEPIGWQPVYLFKNKDTGEWHVW
ncbi:hypothetical protein Celal_3712 [Cellulophaga algicola DSM 14237]|uniref:Uncharacterized protein n=1 Tax=Cellulophaga algicola (strain DSM 14237 / IC166 / ACAM 630) TaxID=688270 RepID=E6XA06_CELAD|nr:hypothetical protein [Cellulophaga algicola]ADV50967.1 hypothetical protein Celal_3712 [Cellulophaga algicola DSM 14237]